MPWMELFSSNSLPNNTKLEHRLFKLPSTLYTYQKKRFLVSRVIAIIYTRLATRQKKNRCVPRDTSPGEGVWQDLLHASSFMQIHASCSNHSRRSNCWDSLFGSDVPRSAHWSRSAAPPTPGSGRRRCRSNSTDTASYRRPRRCLAGKFGANRTGSR